MRPAVNPSFVTGLAQELVRINSVNPSLVPGAPGEAAIAACLAGQMRALGMDVTRLESEPGRVTTVGRLRGATPGPVLLWCGHVDTVGFDEMQEPLSGRIDGDRLYGRGAFDMKTGVAAMVGAARALAEAGCPFAGEILVAGVADEEAASLGTIDALRHVRADAAVITEPTSFDLCVAHKGFVWFTVTTHGRAAHGSRVDLGVDANMRMGRVLAELEGLEQQLRHRPPHALVGPPSLHAAMLHGGTGASTYAASCTLTIERRTIPGESEASARAEIQAILDRLVSRDRDFVATLDVTLSRAPFEVSPDAPIVRAASAAVAAVRGRVPALVGQTPWMDSALLSEAGIDTVILGASGAGAHERDEWADLPSTVALAECLVDLALRGLR